MSTIVSSTKHGIRLLMDFALSHGWKVSRTQGGHIRFTKPGMPAIFTSSTPGDYRTELNTKPRLRCADRFHRQFRQEATDACS
jgi:predicted RNA binding protein YcfA (HicA-like mRNA interferase family)